MIDELLIGRLRAIGLAPPLIPQLLALPLPMIGADALLPMRVTEVQREGLTLHDGSTEQAARLLPALRAELQQHGDAIAVGDWTLARRNAFGEWWVEQRLAPINQLARRLHDGRDKVTRAVVVSNVDTALLVMGLDGDFNLRRLERYVALVRLAGIGAVVVLTKKDLVADAADKLRAVEALLPPAVAARAIDALGDEPRQALAPWLQHGQTLVLLGSSGAGKSTLTNALIGGGDGDGGGGGGGGGAQQRTGANRGGDSRGRHTTTARSLHTTPGGACIIDTPGLRTLRLDGDADALGSVFDDIAQLAPQCRFRDCSHADEPGCAVRGTVSEERLRNYRKLLREAQRDALTALQRKVQVRQWKARGHESRLRMEAKRG